MHKLVPIEFPERSPLLSEVLPLRINAMVGHPQQAVMHCKAMHDMLSPAGSSLNSRILEPKKLTKTVKSEF